MDADYYVNMITENYKNMKSLEIEGWVLQFDNNPKHKCTKAKENLKNKNIKLVIGPTIL